MTELEQVLMKRDNMSLAEVRQLISDARKDFDEYPENYIDVDQFMEEWFGLEPDYIFDVLL